MHRTTEPVSGDLRPEGVWAKGSSATVGLSWPVSRGASGPQEDSVGSFGCVWESYPAVVGQVCGHDAPGSSSRLDPVGPGERCVRVSRGPRLVTVESWTKEKTPPFFCFGFCQPDILEILQKVRMETVRFCTGFIYCRGGEELSHLETITVVNESDRHTDGAPTEVYRVTIDVVTRVSRVDDSEQAGVVKNGRV